jgi:hypothetical protein
MKTRTLAKMAQPLKRAIGSHYRMASDHAGYTAEAYAEARRDSDEAVSLAKYLIQHLDNRHDAVCFAAFVGMPGYINLR